MSPIFERHGVSQNKGVNMLNHQRLKCYEYSMLLAKKMPSLVRKWPKGNYYLADQLKRALASVSLNIAEGSAKSCLKDRARFFAIARGSAAEASAIIDIANAYNMIDPSTYEEFQDKLLQIIKILYKLQ